MTMPLSEQDLILLNAYLDDELPAGERAAFEQRLARDPALRAELEALQVTVSLMQMAERVPVPRNFTLDPAVYGKPERRGLLAGLFRPAGLAVVGATLSTVMLCVGAILFAGGQITGGGAATVAMEAAPAEAPQINAPEFQAEAAVEEAAPEGLPQEEEAPAAEAMEEAAPAADEAAEAPSLAEEEALPPSGASGEATGSQPEEGAPEAAFPTEVAPLPAPTPTAGAARAEEEEGPVGAGEASPPQATAPPRQPVDTTPSETVAPEVPPARLSAVPLWAILFAIGGAGLIVSLVGLIISRLAR
ncbi:MAG TPA: hypothetical protein ENI95_04425 [Chloroflexi bacterium]|nr:hypothetical protein [Chloroflexota bacterium]